MNEDVILMCVCYNLIFGETFNARARRLMSAAESLFFVFVVVLNVLVSVERLCLNLLSVCCMILGLCLCVVRSVLIVFSRASSEASASSAFATTFSSKDFVIFMLVNIVFVMLLMRIKLLNKIIVCVCVLIGVFGDKILVNTSASFAAKKSARDVSCVCAYILSIYNDL